MGTRPIPTWELVPYPYGNPQTGVAGVPMLGPVPYIYIILYYINSINAINSIDATSSNSATDRIDAARVLQP